MDVVGKTVLKKDVIGKVTGRLKYTEDLFTDDMLVAKIFTSTIGNGRVVSIDTTAAKALSGVVEVFTYEDVPQTLFSTAGHPWNPKPASRDVRDRLILDARVRFYGDSIAVVVAIDELTAKKAVSLIKVEYEEYEVLVDPIKAQEEGKPLLHEGFPKNILGYSKHEDENYAKAWASGSKHFEGEYSIDPVFHGHIEKAVCYAYLDEYERVNIFSPIQVPHLALHIVAEALEIPEQRIRIVKPNIGGSFGNKQDVLFEPLVGFLALKLAGRKVRLAMDYEDVMVGTRTRYGTKLVMRTSTDEKGIIKARSFSAVTNGGAYASHGHAVAGNMAKKYRYLYKQDALGFDVKTVYTNIAAAGAMRGYGIPQVKFGLEAHMDDIARELAIDPLEFRLKNIVDGDFVDKLSGARVHSYCLPECIAKGRELINWDEKRAKYNEPQFGNIRYGIGMACYTYETGVFPHSLEMGGARIVLNMDGSINLQLGATEMGQGSDTVLAQMAAEELGISYEKINVISQQDTDVTPFDCGSYASRQSYICGMAVKTAAAEVKKKILCYLKRWKDIPNFAAEIKKDNIYYKSTGELIISIAELAKNSFFNLTIGEPITADIHLNVRNNTISFGSAFAEVAVDIQLGKIEVLNLYSIHDVGKVLNPQMAEGQVHGGVSMALGMGLSEQMLYDDKTGKPLNNTLLDYKLPTFMDTPIINAVFIEAYDPTGPFGNKALGETPVLLPAVAVRNAVLQATGVGFNELPMTPQRLISKFKRANLI